MLRVLSLLEARVLGVLVEKERTVPDSYPLTLNALVAGCNQKSSRDPVLNATETDVRAAVEGLKSMLLAIERSGGRVARYAHNVERMMNVPRQAAALLAVLMLRGPQTAGELRMNCERLHCFADIPAVEALLNELAERSDGALVAQLPRQPGSRENRWTHLLSGAPAVQSSSFVIWIDSHSVIGIVLLEMLFRGLFYCFYRALVIEQPVMFHQVQSLGEW